MILFRTLKTRWIVITVAVSFAVLVLIGLAALYTLQTKWFKDRVREKIISAVENATGGQVELGSFNYDWRRLTATFGRLVVHGTEPSGSPPLFQAKSVSVGLKVISFLKREVDISSLVMERPEIYLLVRRDGTTNIPSPKMHQGGGNTVEQLLNLKLRRFEFNHGSIGVEMRRMPLSVRGENVSLLVKYDRAGPRYDLSISSPEVGLESEMFRPFSASLDAAARLEGDRLVIQRFALLSRGSKLQADGTVEPLAHPIVDLKLNAQLDTSDLARIAKISELRDGRLSISGTAHYDQFSSWMFQGKAAGRNLAYRWKSFVLKNASFESELDANREELKFGRLTLTELNSQLSGEAVLKHFRDFQVDGKVSDLDIRTVGTWFTDRPLLWSGVANGPVHLAGSLNDSGPHFTVQTDLQIAPVSGGIPISGNVDLSYAKRGDVIQFGDSHLDSPSTQLRFSGVWGASLQVALDTSNLDDLRPLSAFSIFQTKVTGRLPILVSNGYAHFDGTIAGPLVNSQIQGNVALTHFRIAGQTWDQARSRIELSMGGVDFSSLIVDQGSFHASGNGHIGLAHWAIREDGELRLKAQFSGADLRKMMSEYSDFKLPLVRGIGSGVIDLNGSWGDPQGSAQINIENAEAYGERLNRVQISAAIQADQVRINQGRLRAGPALLSFAGVYNHAHGSWTSGRIKLKLDSNGFPLASLSPVQKYDPGLNAQFEVHGEAGARVTPGHIEPTQADGTLAFRNVTVNNVPYGSLTLNASTRGTTLDTIFSGDLRESHLNGTAQVQLVPGNPVKGEIHLGRLQLQTLYALLNAGQTEPLPFDGFVQGGLTFEGPLQKIEQLRGSIQLQEIQLRSSLPGQSATQAKPDDLIFRNVGPIVLDAWNGVASVRSFRIAGKDTSLSVAGSISYAQQRSINLSVNGSADLRIFQLFDPNVQSSGQSSVAATVGGTLTNPSVNGTLELRNGAFSLKNVSNGLSAVNGTLKFDRDRATIQKLTARTGGGELALAGFASFGAGPLVYRLEANAENVRVRYAGGISVTANSELRLTGTSENGLLSGTVTVSRVVLNSSTDVGAVLASFGAPVASPANEKDFLTGLQLDVRMESAPNLLLSTALSRDVEAEIDLRLRGTPSHPVLLGSVAANQGDIKVFGTKYSINRGEVSFSNTVKIEPVLDLDLQTEARGIIVDVTISGAIGKLNINYRSDPPLQPRDIIALLTVGRTPNSVSNMPNAQVTNDVSALQSGANTVLGQAISPVSNRLSKLFGITNIKIDPLVQGITNTPQARLTIEQQISREITVTYVTNLSETSEQIFRVEYAFSQQYSLVALRDDNGEFGIDIQYKKRFR